MPERSRPRKPAPLRPMPPNLLAPAILLLTAGLSSLPPSLAATGEQPSHAVLAPADESGTRLFITGSVTSEDGRPVPGACLHLYQTDATGSYSRDKPMDEPHARLAGWATKGTARGVEGELAVILRPPPR